MTEFMYLFRGGDANPNQSPEAMQAEMQKWMHWMQGLSEAGKLSAGLPLNKEGKVVSKATVTDGPFTEGKEVVGGYLIVKADSLEEATQITKGCPILDTNGTIEVRELRPM